MRIVSNTTPLSNFLHLGILDILLKVCPDLQIPMAVRQELDQGFASNPQWQAALKSKNIHIGEPTNLALVMALQQELHKGEAEAIALALEVQADVCLIDDRDARQVAESLGIKLSGTFGVLIKAKHKGYLSSVKNAVDTLRKEHRFWVSEDLYGQVLKIAGEME